MKFLEYLPNNPEFNAPTVKCSYWFSFIKRQYYFDFNITRWRDCSTGETQYNAQKLCEYAIVQNRKITAKLENKVETK